jgi:hypothetical protein
MHTQVFILVAKQQVQITKIRSLRYVEIVSHTMIVHFGGRRKNEIPRASN